MSKKIYKTISTRSDSDNINQKYQKIFKDIFKYAEKGDLKKLNRLSQEILKKDLLYTLKCYPERLLLSLLTCATDQYNHFPFDYITLYKHQAILDKLFQKTKTYDIATRFYFAVGFNQIDIVSDLTKTDKTLLENQFGEDEKIFSEYPVFTAARNGFLEILNIFLNNGCDLNIRDNKNCNLLDVAARYGHLNVVKFLINQGLKTNTINDDTCLQVIRDDYWELFLFLYEKNCFNKERIPNFLISAIRNNEIKIALFLIDNMSMRKDIAELQASMSFASDGNHVEVVKKLLEKGIKDENTLSHALLNATNRMNLEMVKLLLQFHAPITSEITELAKRKNSQILEVLNTHIEKREAEKSCFGSIKIKFNFFQPKYVFSEPVEVLGSFCHPEPRFLRRRISS